MNEHDLAAIARYTSLSGSGCHGLVVREGEEDACEKPSVAIIDGRDYEDGDYWPACAYHANRYGRGKCVPLTVISRAVQR